MDSPAEVAADAELQALSQRTGAAFEALVAATLRHQGAIVQPITTPSVMRAGRRVPTSQVIGDLVGCTADGKALLVECKARAGGRKPRPSDFKPHQRAILSRWAKQGGTALVAGLNANGKVLFWTASEILGPPSEILGEGA